ncbi:MAG: hypothetical protein ISS18_10195 [Bacteroidales bacterium]|nr:hypothetical protein [Bacteroidales bacterium]
MKKILVINYSQSGQLNEIIDNFLIPFNDKQIERVNIFPKKVFPFPWSSQEFFDVMPESVLEKKIELEPYHLKSENYELIIIGYQPWYLSPSLPTTALLKDEKFTSLLKGKPVVTITGARNMWLNAQESVKEHIQKAGGELVANIPFIDRNTNLISAVTILYWMLTGEKGKYLNIFPYPGVSEKDIKGASKFGEIVFEAFQNDSYHKLQNKILDLKLINIKTDILFIELRAKRLFKIWARIIINKDSNYKKRAIWIKLFKYYLLVALFIVAPIVLTVYNLLIAPFTFNAINRKKEYFCGIRKNKNAGRLHNKNF